MNATLKAWLATSMRYFGRAIQPDRSPATPAGDALEAELATARARNEVRARHLIEQLGTAYVCHPENKVSRSSKT